MLKFIENYFKKLHLDYKQRNFQAGFEQAMSAHHLHGATIDELAAEVSKRPDEFDLGILKAIRIIIRNS